MTERLAFLRGPAGGGRMLTAEECRELADAYEAARDAAQLEWQLRVGLTHDLNSEREMRALERSAHHRVAYERDLLLAEIGNAHT